MFYTFLFNWIYIFFSRFGFSSLLLLTYCVWMCVSAISHWWDHYECFVALVRVWSIFDDFGSATAMRNKSTQKLIRNILVNLLWFDFHSSSWFILMALLVFILFFVLYIFHFHCCAAHQIYYRKKKSSTLEYPRNADSIMDSHLFVLSSHRSTYLRSQSTIFVMFE